MHENKDNRTPRMKVKINTYIHLKMNDSPVK